MRIAVTGAGGFLGRHVLADLARRGIDDVVACGRAPRDDPPPAGAATWRYFALETIDPDRAYELMGRPEVVIHLAWGGLPRYDSLHHFEHELPAHYRFLRGLVDGGLPALVVAGTCFEYGMRDGALAASEETHPANPYAYAKDALRRQLRFLQRHTSFRLSWNRLFYMWGEGQAAGSLHPALMRAIAEGQASFPMSPGDQLRDFLPVETVAGRLVDRALDPAADGVANICSGTPVSVRAMAERWIAEADASIALDLGRRPYSPYEPLAFWGIPS